MEHGALREVEDADLAGLASHHRELAVRGEAERGDGLAGTGTLGHLLVAREEAGNRGGEGGGQVRAPLGGGLVELPHGLRLAQAQERERVARDERGVFLARRHRSGERLAHLRPDAGVLRIARPRALRDREIAQKVGGRHCRPRGRLERGHRPFEVAESEEHAALEVRRPRGGGLALRSLLHARADLVVPEAGSAPVEAHAIRGRLQVLGGELEGVLQELLCLLLAAQVEQRDRAVVEAVGGVAPACGSAAGTGGRCLGYARTSTAAASHSERGRASGPREAAASRSATAAGCRPGRPAPCAVQVRARGQLGAGDAELPGAPAQEHLEHAEAQLHRSVRRVRALPARLLGRHVGGRAAGPPGDMVVSSALRAPVAPPPGAAARRAGQAEVGDLGHAVRRQHQVGGLDVAVHEPLLVRVVQAPGELDGHVEDRVEP